MIIHAIFISFLTFSLQILGILPCSKAVSQPLSQRVLYWSISLFILLKEMSTPLGDIDLAVGQKYYILPRIKSKDKTLHGTRPEQGQIHRIQPRLLSWTHHLLEPMQASQWLMNLFPCIPSSHCSWSMHLWFHLCVSPRSNSHQSCCHLSKRWDFADGTMSIFLLSLLFLRCPFGVLRASKLQKLEIKSGG